MDVVGVPRLIHCLDSGLDFGVSVCVAALGAGDDNLGRKSLCSLSELDWLSIEGSWNDEITTFKFSKHETLDSIPVKI